MRKGLSTIRVTLALLVILVAIICAASASSSAPRNKALPYRVIGHGDGYVVVGSHRLTLVVRDHEQYTLARDGRLFRVVKRASRYVVLRRVSAPRATGDTTATALPGVPVSVGKPSKASSASTGTPPAAANDGRANTRWVAAGSKAYPQWWMVDLGASMTVRGVSALWRGRNRVYRYRIEASLDGAEFATVADRSRNRTRGNTTDAFTVAARYVRVTVLGVSPSGVAASAYEITVNGDPPFYGRTFTTYTVPAGTHDVVYENCTFTGGGATNAVLTINRPCYNIVFRNCTIDKSPYNGVSIVDTGGSVHDIRFEGCHFLSSARMGFECISRPPSGVTTGYSHIDLVDCVFETQGSEAVSYDGEYSGNCRIENVVIKGSGTNPAYPWHQGLEFNKVTNMTVRNLTIYRTAGAALNLRSKATNSGFVFEDCNFDMVTAYDGITEHADTAIFSGDNVRHAVFRRCTFKTNHGRAGWLNDCTDNDFSTCTYVGALDGSANSFLRLYGTACAGNLLPPNCVLL